MMNEKRFKLSKYVTPSSVSYFCDENGRMLNKEVVKVLNEQQARIKELEKENEQLKQQLLYDGDDVCSICKHEYLTPCGDYFIGKCEKGHEECSKEDIQYCEDFKLKR